MRTSNGERPVLDYLRAITIAACAGLTAVFGAAAIMAGAVTPPSAALLLASCTVMIAAYWRPMAAGYANAALWICACLIPPLSAATLLTALPAAATCMLATHRHPRRGGCIAIVQVLALAAGAMAGTVTGGFGDGMESEPTVGVLPLVASPLLGLLMAWWERLDHARTAQRELEERRRAMAEQDRRARAATRIHDRVTNRLAYLILRMDNDRADWESAMPDDGRLLGELRDLAAVARDALEETRGVIDILDGNRLAGIDENDDDSENAEHSNVMNGSDADPIGETAMLRDHLAEAADRLTAIGFDVDAGLDGALPAGCNVEAIDALHDLIDETCNNIAKHARPHTACRIRVMIRGGTAMLDSCNVVGDGHTQESMSAGTGLHAKAAQFQRLGGTIDHTITRAEDGTPQWRLSATLPIGSAHFAVHDSQNEQI